MTLKEYMQEQGWRYQPSDEKLEKPFCELSDRITQFKSKVTRRAFFFDGKRLRRTIRDYDSLSPEEREKFVRDHISPESNNMDIAGIVLRSFGKHLSVYDELLDRLNITYSVRDKDGQMKRVTRNALKNIYPFSTAEQEVQKFASRYSEIRDYQKGPLLWALADLLTLATDSRVFAGLDSFSYSLTGDQKPVKRIFRAVNKRMPHKLESIGNPENLEEMGFGEQSRFLYNNRERILRAHQKVDIGNLEAYQDRMESAFGWQIPREFFELPQTELNLLYQACYFYKQTAEAMKEKGESSMEVTRSFNSGCAQSLKSGNIGPWAKTIVEHFRNEAKGGGHYRVLGGEAA